MMPEYSFLEPFGSTTTIMLVQTALAFVLIPGSPCHEAPETLTRALELLEMLLAMQLLSPACLYRYCPSAIRCSYDILCPLFVSRRPLVSLPFPFL